MIDLHCHILPGLDDGAADPSVSLAMARMALADGIDTVACTPHVEPGVYDNSGSTIFAAIEGLRQRLEWAGLGLALVGGADVHMAPNLAAGLASGAVPTLGGSRYFLLEPPFDVMPPMLDRLVASLVTRGFVPILTHPERLAWIETHYAQVARITAAGALVQLTAGSITGAFGRRARYWAERLLDESRVDLVATDAHNVTSRPPVMSAARQAIADRCGEIAAEHIVTAVPAAILADEAVPERPESTGAVGRRASGWAGALFGARR